MGCSCMFMYLCRGLFQQIMNKTLLSDYLLYAYDKCAYRPSNNSNEEHKFLVMSDMNSDYSRILYLAFVKIYLLRVILILP